MFSIKNCSLSFCFTVIFLMLKMNASAQTGGSAFLSNEKVQASIGENGNIEILKFKTDEGWKEVAFRNDCMGGPAFHINHRPLDFDYDSRRKCFYVLEFGIMYSLYYTLEGGSLVLNASIENRSTFDYEPVSAGIIIGLDALMEAYPSWNEKHFPTLLRAEKSHFWGYAMSPSGTIVGIASPDAIASWSINYFKDHYVKSFNVDLLNKNPLPERHPHGLSKLVPGEKRLWKIYLTKINSLSDVKFVMSELCDAPMIDAKGDYTFFGDEKKSINIISDDSITVELISPDGVSESFEPIKYSKRNWTVGLSLDGSCGHYRLLARNSHGKQSEALLYKRKPWSYYLDKARMQTLDMPPQPSIYAESYYSGYTIYEGKRYVPEKKADERLDSIFRDIFKTMYRDTENGLYVIPNVRVQSIYTAIGVLVRAYKAWGRIEDIEMAGKLADHLIKCYQSEDGVYRNSGGIYYTSVIYGTKPMFELALVEKEIGGRDKEWIKKSERHYSSAKRAVEDLLNKLDNIQTEGEQTFEDGMISCSALQLGFYALLTEYAEERKRYTEALRYMLDKHACLAQTEIPDARMNGGTLRFWEGWYDIRLKPHVLNSPHGWSSWRTYATYYMYLLTGEEKWLRETMDAVSSAMQVIDVRRDGYMNWGFIPDPYVEATYAVEDSLHKGKTVFTTGIIGEQYMPLTLRWRKDHGGDNTVHEHFKMLSEVALPNAFIIEREDGTFITYNCDLKRKGKSLYITPYDDVVVRIHCNLKKKYRIQVAGKPVEYKVGEGMHWLEIKSEI